MSNYTEADVERWAKTLQRVMDNPKFDPELRLLVAAALEGAKVPGLVADNAALAMLVRRVRDGGYKLVYDDGAFLTFLADADSALAKEHPGADLLAELEDVRAAWHRETERADALQARVKELEDESEISARRGAQHVRSLEARVVELEENLAAMHAQNEEQSRDLEATRLAADQLRRDLDEERTRVQDGESERDALRAQVEAMRAASTPLIDWCRRSLEARGIPSGPMVKAGEARAFVAALSAPPAETTPAPNSPAVPDGSTAPERCASCPHPPHIGACLRRNGQTAYQCPCNKDTLPAPERAKKKRSCNVHHDCDTEEGVMDPCCNDSDCPDHQ